MKPTKVKISFEPVPEKLEKLLLMNGDKIVALTSSIDTGISQLAIYNAHGVLERTHNLGTRVVNCGSIDGDEVFYLLVKLRNWGIFNLNTLTQRVGGIDLRSQSLIEPVPFFFPKSNAILIAEGGNFNLRDGKFCYYTYPKEGGDVQKLWEHNCIGTFSLNIKQLDDTGRIVVFNERAFTKGEFNWHVLDLQTKTSVEYKVEAPKEPYQQHHLQYVAQMPNGVFMLLTSNIEEFNVKQHHTLFSYEPNTNTLNILNKEPVKYRVAPRQIFQLDNWLVIPETYQNEKCQMEKAPLRMIDLTTGQLANCEETVAGEFNTKFSASNTSPKYILRVEADIESPKEAHLEYTFPFSHTELYVHMLKQLSHEKMPTYMIQHVIDIFEDDFD